MDRKLSAEQIKLDDFLNEGLEASIQAATGASKNKEKIALEDFTIRERRQLDRNTPEPEVPGKAPPPKTPPRVERRRQEQERALPYSEAGEKGLLCSLLLDPRAVAMLCAGLSIDAFCIPAHRIIYDTVYQWPNPGKVDFTWLCETLGRKQLDEVGGKEYLNELLGFVLTSANASFYLDLVLNTYRRRRAILFGNKVATLCSDHREDLADKLLEWEQEFSEILHGDTKGKENRDLFKLSQRTIYDLLDLEIDPGTNLLGDRWLPRDGSGFIIAPSGHGKSSMALQAAILWSIGRIVFGIKPARPLRILFLQSEDDDAESKKFVQLIRKLGLSSKDIELMRENTRFEFRRDLTGARFIQAVDDFLTEWPADILIINPLSGFLLCDLKNDEKVNHFLRGDLNTLMAKHKCAPLVFHHTPKTNFVKLETMQWYDWMYAMSGCAGLTNWARAVLVIAPSKMPGTYRFIAAKRFNEIQWTEREYWYSHSKKMFKAEDGTEHTIMEWVASGEDQIASAKPGSKGRKKDDMTAQKLWEAMSSIQKYTKAEWREWAWNQFRVGRDRADGFLDTLLLQNMIQLSLLKRHGTNDLKLFEKVAQPNMEAASEGNQK